MKLKKMALIAEIVGSAAVVVSLIVLMFQLRENTAAINASTRQSASARIEERTIAVAANPTLLAALAESRAGNLIDDSSAEGIQLRFFYSSMLTSVEEAYLQYLDGRLEPEYLRNRAARAIIPNFRNPTAQAYLRVVRADGHYDTEFLDWIEVTFLQDGN